MAHYAIKGVPMLLEVVVVPGLIEFRAISALNKNIDPGIV